MVAGDVVPVGLVVSGRLSVPAVRGLPGVGPLAQAAVVTHIPAG
jgi:hypothetical protein